MKTLKRFYFSGWRVDCVRRNGFWALFIYDPAGKLRRTAIKEAPEDKLESLAQKEVSYARRN